MTYTIICVRLSYPARFCTYKLNEQFPNSSLQNAIFRLPTMYKKRHTDSLMKISRFLYPLYITIFVRLAHELCNEKDGGGEVADNLK